MLRCWSGQICPPSVGYIQFPRSGFPAKLSSLSEMSKDWAEWAGRLPIFSSSVSSWISKPLSASLGRNFIRMFVLQCWSEQRPSVGGIFSFSPNVFSHDMVFHLPLYVTEGAFCLHSPVVALVSFTCQSRSPHPRYPERAPLPHWSKEPVE